MELFMLSETEIAAADLRVQLVDNTGMDILYPFAIDEAPSDKSELAELIAEQFGFQAENAGKHGHIYRATWEGDYRLL